VRARIPSPIDKIIIVIIIIILTVLTIMMMIQPDQIQVTNRGQIFTLSPTEVGASLLSVEPERVAKYGVTIHGHEYPVLQVLAAATGTPKIEWSTVNAYRILQKLGFDINVHE